MRAGSSLKDEAREREMCFYNIKAIVQFHNKTYVSVH